MQIRGKDLSEYGSQAVETYNAYKTWAETDENDAKAALKACKEVVGYINSLSDSDIRYLPAENETLNEAIATFIDPGYAVSLGVNGIKELIESSKQTEQELAARNQKRAADIADTRRQIKSMDRDGKDGDERLNLEIWLIQEKWLHRKQWDTAKRFEQARGLVRGYCPTQVNVDWADRCRDAAKDDPELLADWEAVAGIIEQKISLDDRGLTLDAMNRIHDRAIKELYVEDFGGDDFVGQGSPHLSAPSWIHAAWQQISDYDKHEASTRHQNILNDINGASQRTVAFDSVPYGTMRIVQKHPSFYRYKGELIASIEVIPDDTLRRKTVAYRREQIKRLRAGEIDGIDQIKWRLPDNWTIPKDRTADSS